jgi:hypothetical protein
VRQEFRVFSDKYNLEVTICDLKIAAKGMEGMKIDLLRIERSIRLIRDDKVFIYYA